MKEDKIQSQSFQWFNNTYCLKHHPNRCMMFSVPNELGGKIAGALKKLGVNESNATKIVRIITSTMKAMGMMSGVSDTIILLPGKPLFVEFKTGTGYQSDSQKEFQFRIESMGYKYLLCRSFEEFKEKVEKEM